MDLKIEGGQEMDLSFMGPPGLRLEPSCSSKLALFIIAVWHTQALNGPYSHPCADNNLVRPSFATFSNPDRSRDIVRAEASPLVILELPSMNALWRAYRIVGVQTCVPMCPYICTLEVIVSIR